MRQALSGSTIRLSIGLAASAMAMAGLASPAFAQSYESYGASAGQAAVGRALDAVQAPDTSPYADILDAVDGLPNAAARADALGHLGPSPYRLMPRLSIQSMDATDREIRGYLAQRRELALDASADVPASGDRTINVMVSYGLKQGKYKARPDRPRADFDSRSIRAGFDISPVPGLILGTSIGIDGIDANLDRNQNPRSTVFNANVTPYASYTNGRYYVDATAGYTRSWYQLRRQVNFTGFSDRLQSGPNGDNAAATVEAGGILKLGVLRAQPFAGLHYRYADLGGLVESGGAASLAVAKFKTESVRSSLGLRASASLKKGAWTLRPSVEGQWQRELRSRPESRIEAIFLAGGTPIFTLPSTRYDRDGAVVGAGISATHGERTGLRLSYTGEFGNDRRIHGFAVTANHRF
ncbi:autotransporter outer membrane beta-barrel domain-containing protein [Novosphingobium kaempferiae]|uniref:autotransporter outer membrane beta-barrel domain-containing protein n=1 Tax=Novosphingobium kaempferiae TaxID=2896849 RepID=UPI001E638B12|nr:autotransporter outer membrane beta-barrel domain-containing protein [Novosphingobium kaempferiae]